MSSPLLMKPDQGTARLIVEADDLAMILAGLPQSYRVLSSEQATRQGQVVLRVASTDIYGDHMTVQADITDAGSTRTFRIIPVEA